MDDLPEGYGDRATPGGTVNAPPITGSRANAAQPAEPHQLRNPKKNKGRHTKAAMTIGTLNINGKGNLNGPTNNKWNAINQLMREQHIGILALQETHLDSQSIEDIHRLYGRRLRILNSQAGDSTSSQGVAFVLNRELVDISNVALQELWPGRAIRIKMRWHGETTITLVNVYAPNDMTQNATFWAKLQENPALANSPKTDVLLGDFNIVEDAVDRLPARPDNVQATNALQDLIRRLSLCDGWRTTEPHAKEYSFPQRASTSRSRIDRIYVTEDIAKSSYTWNIRTTGVPTDHKLVSAKISVPQAPHIGKGKWSLPLQILNDQNFIQETTKLGMKALERARRCGSAKDRSAEENPQLIHKLFKQQVAKLARDILKTKTPKLKAAIERLTEQATLIQASSDFTSNEAKQTETAVLQDRITELERKRHQAIRSVTTARYAINDESLSKYWSNINKDRKPRDIIYNLQKPDKNPPEFETRSDKMAELARNYHDNLQKEDTGNKSDHERAKKTGELLTATRPLDISPELLDLTEHISEQCIQDALRKTQTGKASGLDGIPYELWTTLQKIHAKADEDEASFDVLALLEILYNDINRYGIEKESEFTDGWMCPLYKKKDRRDIANYRPITLLNTDYKLYTQILAMRLAPIASTIIHSDQAGFLPGRKISDQTQLCRVMVDYAEATEENGAIIALDQEKAYDKILHEYLWKTLEAMGLPEKFIKWIQNLYKHATTVVIINGELSTPFLVIRGVRQGDPLSCLLFDLAIEPLACAIRASNLRGFRVPGMAERLVASLFADDTSTFLSQDDKWSDLWAVLDNWCEASGARFNKGKTEVVPVGTTEYRQSVTATRKLNQHADEPELPDFVHIAGDGEPVRMLGAWIGNKTDQAAIWAPTIHKVNAFLERWKRCHPTMKGKKNIIQMGPGGITQYLTEVQGMPREIEDTLTKMIRHFIWDSDRPPPVNMETLCRPIEEGGLGILDIKTRNEAIELMWLKRYLTLTPDRPRWAFLVDAILAIRVTKEAGAIKKNAQINTFLQDWHPATHAKSKLPTYLKRLLTTAKKHNACFAAVKLGPLVKQQLPAWYHISADKHLRRLNNTSLSNCLRDKHDVRIVADLMTVTQHPPLIQSGQAGEDTECACETCNSARDGGCKHPTKCREAAARIIHNLSEKWNPHQDNAPDGLSLTAKRKEHNEKAFEEDGTAIFDPSLTTRGGVSEAIRVFVEEETIMKAPAIRQRNGRTVPAETSTVYVMNAPKHPGREGARPNKAQSDGQGFVYFAKDDPRNNLVYTETHGKVEEGSWAEAAAALHAVQATPPDAPLNIVGETNYLVTELVQKIHQSEDRGWLNVPNQNLLRALVNQLRQRCAPTTLRAARTREDQREYRSARQEATQARRQHNEPITIEKKTNPVFDLSGVRLATLTQKLAYQYIREKKAVETRRATQRTMSKIIEHTKEQSGTPADPTSIWRGIRNRDIRRNIQDFLWKCTHNAHKCGEFWESIPGYEERGTCHTCGAIDSMDHILTRCKAPGQDTVWKMAGNLWKRKKLRWSKPATEDILTTGIRQWRHESGRAKRRPRAERLWRILVTESAFLIWKLRCERVIGHSDDESWHHTESAIRTRWTRMVNERLHLDMAMTHRRFGRKALKRSEVLGTWQGTLIDELALPDDWTALNWVLVGIEAAH